MIYAWVKEFIKIYKFFFFSFLSLIICSINTEEIINNPIAPNINDFLKYSGNKSIADKGVIPKKKPNINNAFFILRKCAIQTCSN